MWLVGCGPKKWSRARPGELAIKATLYLYLNQLEQPPFKLILHSIMSDARLRRVNKEIAGASDGQFICALSDSP